MKEIDEFKNDMQISGPACLGWVPSAYKEFVQLVSENKLPGVTLEQFRQIEKDLQESLK